MFNLAEIFMQNNRIVGSRARFAACTMQALLALSLVACGSVSTAAAALPGGFSGAAFGAVAGNVTGPLAKMLHKPAYRPLPCGGTNGALISNSVSGYAAGLDGQVLSAGAISSTLITSATSI